MADLHDWDERYHALVAKNMIEQPFKPMLYKNPVLPYDYKDWDLKSYLACISNHCRFGSMSAINS